MLPRSLPRHPSRGRQLGTNSLIVIVSSSMIWLQHKASCYRGHVSGPGVSICNSGHNAITWRAESRTHLSKQTSPSTEHSRKASNVWGIPSRTDDQLRWVLMSAHKSKCLWMVKSHTHRQVASTMLSIES